MHLVQVFVASLLAACTLGLGDAPARAHEPCEYLEPTSANGPCFVVEPSAGPVGTRVHFRVRVGLSPQEGWLSDWRRHPSLRLFKRIPQTENSRCMFTVPSRPFRWHVVRTAPYNPDAAVNPKAVVGWLTVGGVGRCEGEKLQQVMPGRYLLSTSWGHGAFARFRVLPGELPATGGMSVAAPAVLGGLLVLLGSGVLWAFSGSRNPTIAREM